MRTYTLGRKRGKKKAEDDNIQHLKDIQRGMGPNIPEGKFIYISMIPREGVGQIEEEEEKALERD